MSQDNNFDMPGFLKSRKEVAEKISLKRVIGFK